MKEQMKPTLWIEIKWDECEIETFDDSESIRVKHPKFKRARYFIKSQAGNYYWRNTGRDSGIDVFAEGIIIK